MKEKRTYIRKEVHAVVSKVCEVGRVTEVMGDQVKVVIQRHATCESCRSCGMAGRPEVALWVANRVDAVKGDMVRLQMSTDRMFQAAFLMYTIPLLMLITGYYLGQAAAEWLHAKTEMIGIVAGLCTMGLTYVMLHLWQRQKRQSARFQPELLEIIVEPDPQTPASW